MARGDLAATPSMIYISCQFDTPLGRSDYSDYVRALQLDVSAYDEVGNRILLGKIAADQVLIGDAQSNGMPQLDVCDQDSQGLYEIYEALFDDKGEFQPELNIDVPADSLIFVWRAVLHSRIRPYLQGVIDTIGTLFGNETVLAMWQQTTDLSDAELSQLGFRRIAGSNLIYRHSALRSDFYDDHPSGMDVPLDFEADESDEEWVLAEWKKDKPEISDDEN
jgi:hypothetical protein